MASDFFTTFPLAYIDPGSGMVIAGAGGWILGLLAGAFGFAAIFFKRLFRFFKKRWYLLLILFLALIASTIIAMGAFMKNKRSEFDKKIIILGFDGLSPAILEPLLKEGKLPNFSRLKDRGSYSRFGTVNPPQSPVAWATFATGQNPGKHGIFDFITRSPDTYGLRLTLSNFEKGKPVRPIKTKCFWQYASEAGVPAIMLNCPDTFPPDEINGKMLSGMGVPDILGTEGTFTFYTSENLANPQDVGGKVFSVRKSPLMILNFIGPRRATKDGKSEHTKVPFKVMPGDKKNAVTIEYQNNKFSLETGKWSDWKEVSFDLGFFRKIKGITKLILIETEPEFKLYISPINLDPRAPYFRISTPKKYSRELAKKIGLYHTSGMPLDTWGVNEKRLMEDPFLLQANDILEQNIQKFEYELKDFDKGILFSYYESPDIIQHMFWRYIDPEHPLYEPNAPTAYKEMIRSWYQKLDSIVGKALGVIEEGDVLIVLSDHGFTTFRRALHINSWLIENGYQRLENPFAANGRELLLDIDWKNTQAYSIGFGGIFINQRSREKEGIVNPGKETEDLKTEIAEKLALWQDEKYGQKVIESVYRKEDIFWGKFAADAPDLYIGCASGYRASWQSALGGAPEDLIEDNLKKWSGSHLVDPVLVPGIILTNQVIEKKDPSLYDITPTILKIVGYTSEELDELSIDGKPLW